MVLAWTARIPRDKFTGDCDIMLLGLEFVAIFNIIYCIYSDIYNFVCFMIRFGFSTIYKLPIIGVVTLWCAEFVGFEFLQVQAEQHNITISKIKF